MTLTADQAGLLPNDADREFFAEHGFWISPVIIPDAVLDAAERGMARFYAGERDAELPAEVGGWTAADGDTLRKNDYSSLRIDELRDLVHYPLIAGCAAGLIGADSIRLWHDQLLYKPVDAAGTPANVGWHTDRQYWRCCTSERMLTAWVGFHDVDETNGSVAFMDGSHRWDVDQLDFFNPDLTELESRITAQGFPLQARPTRMKRGQVSFHTCRTVHGSGPNHGTAPRRGMAIHLQPGDNRWQPVYKDDGTLIEHANNRLVRADADGPDYTDPRICPQLWPR
ncbi:MAG TPA: phytanoyl-CoA dioxygenase family protein [Mycobacteriales bacterium]|nr:phytanoyl-CoA dioxygenase family protein [Mycobacteriales bacterium]